MKKTPSKIDMYEYSFPIVGGKLKENGEVEILRIIGTTFHIGGNYFITAAHVIEQLLPYQQKGIGKKGKTTKNGEYTLEPIVFNEFEEGKNYEILKDTDIGILHLEVNPNFSFYWSRNQYFPPQIVKRWGFPFSLDTTKNEIYIRALEGKIVSVRNFHQFKKMIKVYEVSIFFPRGISGGFLLNENLKIIGVIVGNTNTEMNIYQVEEKIESMNKTTIYSTKEVMTYGIAITNQEVLKMEFDIISGNVESHLEKHNLIK
jgi:hypothetical protein